MLRNNLALTYRWQGRYEAAEPIYVQALAEHRRLGGDSHPNTVLLLQNLARLHMAQRRFADAATLLEKALAGERKGFGNTWTGEVVAILTRLEITYAELGRWADAAGAARDALTTASQKQPAASEARAGYLSRIGLYQCRSGEFPAAEQTLRECLMLRESSLPDAWTSFDAQSLLGGALLGQKKYAEAAPLLLGGYEGMKARVKTIPPQECSRIPEALDRLIELYTATNRPDEVTKWRAERAKYREAAPAARAVK